MGIQLQRDNVHQSHRRLNPLHVPWRIARNKVTRVLLWTLFVLTTLVATVAYQLCSEPPSYVTDTSNE
jgi:hypothetical protein